MKKLTQKEVFTSKEILYNIDLSKHNFLPQSNVRLLTEADYFYGGAKLSCTKIVQVPWSITNGLFCSFIWGYD
ncbi:MAG: hypothetical protein H0X29_07020 [Parachlamydiaceae bacterium]|nr:hypothetical protein [Parachlamydiaceae bacterium]